MATDVFGNFASTTLSGNGGSITAAATSLLVASSSTFPTITAGQQFRVLCENELMAVTAVSGTTWTVTRGIEGTTAAIHNDGVTITHELTAAFLNGLPALSAVNTWTADQIFNSTGSGNYGMVSAGPGPWDGTSAGHYAGNGVGTAYAANMPSGYSGDLMRLEVAGSTEFQITSNGSIYLGSGNIYSQAGNTFFNLNGSTAFVVGNSTASVVFATRGAGSQTGDLLQAQDSNANPQFGVMNKGTGASPVWALRVRAVANAESMAQSHTAGANTGRAIQVLDDAGTSLGWLNLTA